MSGNRREKMMRIKTAICLGLLAPLGACGGAGDGENKASAVKEIRVENRFHQRLLALDERNRRVGLLRAIRDSRNRCRSVVGGTYQQEYEQLAMWVARCQDDRQWAVFIAPSGQVQVRDCAHSAQLGLPACRAFEPVELEPLPRVPSSQDDAQFNSR